MDNVHEDGIRHVSHPELYFGKWKHATFDESQTTWWKDTYHGDTDFRNDDSFFFAHKNLRNAADPSVLNRKLLVWIGRTQPTNFDVASWVWGTANSPAAKDGNGMIRSIPARGDSCAGDQSMIMR